GDVLQGSGGHRVQTTGAVGAHGGEPGLPQHAQVLGDRRLGDPELSADDHGDRTGGLLAVNQQFQDAAPDWVAQDIERVHADIISAAANISQYLKIVTYSRVPQQTVNG